MSNKEHICKNEFIDYQWPIMYDSIWNMWSLIIDDTSIEIGYCPYCGTELEKQNEQ